ncbi:MAG TPA: NUDIX domain-containing protein [Propionicimonas sp.]|jgi:8-oxo-dGTP pyrophosphatase MutT (NUDIX family)|uniref:NUDIX hydrolase n=1 Tax=Propionicimonas sp. TaxID=1955623 RepID=UPI002F3FB179
MDHDCSFDEDGRWFRYRAAAIIMHAGSVLMACNDAEPYFYSIGGGVQHMETAEAAVRREVSEETGLDLPIDRLAFVHENFFSGSTTSGLGGRYCHELTFYFLMTFDPARPPVVAPRTTGGIREWFEWVDLATYGRGRAAHPTFFATELTQLGAQPKWITTRE